ncbi:hypothetical protein HBB16_19615 [Pseudonocardia sp. MCCB 268]|nr:hypothetical protein [Pseudonocardia cytotoxica]
MRSTPVTVLTRRRTARSPGAGPAPATEGSTGRCALLRASARLREKGAAHRGELTGPADDLVVRQADLGGGRAKRTVGDHARRR